MNIVCTMTPQEIVEKFGSHLSSEERKRLLNSTELSEEDITNLLGHNEWDYVTATQPARSGYSC